MYDTYNMPNKDKIESLFIDSKMIERQWNNLNNDKLHVAATFFYYLFELNETTFYDRFKL